MQPLDQREPGNRRWMFLFLTAIIVIGAIRWHATSTPTSALLAPADRKPLPAAGLPLLDGTQWTPAAHRGQVVLINYWATWCEPCQEETPALTQTFHDLSPRGLAILGISLDQGPDAPAKVQQFIDRFHVPYPIALSTPTWNGASETVGVPTSWLIDRKGRIAKIYAGPIQPRDLTKDIATLLAEPNVI